MVQGAPISPIRGEFAWSQASCVDADEASTGALRLFVGDRLIWGLAEFGVHWHWIDLLEGMAVNWAELTYGGWLEGRVPSGHSVLAELERYEAGVHLQAAVGDSSEADALAALDEAFDWTQAHFLSRLMPGLDVPDVAVWADRDGIAFQTDQFTGVFPRAAAVAALSELGDSIASRLEAQGFGEHAAVAAWRARRAPATDRFATSLVGHDASRLAFARGPIDEAEAWGDDVGDMAATAWSAAAAACHGAQADALKDVFQAIASAPPASGSWLDLLEIANRLRQAMGADSAAFGLELAREARGLAGLGRTAPIGVDTLARGIGLRLVSRPWGDGMPAALAVNKPADAPSIFLNSGVLTAGQEPNRRWLVTAAVSKLLEAALLDAPFAAGLDLVAPTHDLDRFALELMVPLEGLDDFVLGDGASDPLVGACQHFGAPAAVVASQLTRSQVYRLLPPNVLNQVDDALSPSRPPRMHRHLRAVAQL